MDSETYKRLYTELEKIENLGVSITLDDHPASPMQIVTAHMVNEEPSYMRDYEWDENGYMKILSFHNIKKG